jgi:hypothetical protein
MSEENKSRPSETNSSQTDHASIVTSIMNESGYGTEVKFTGEGTSHLKTETDMSKNFNTSYHTTKSPNYMDSFINNPELEQQQVLN